MVVYGKDATNGGVYYRRWNGTVWSGETLLNLSSVISGKARWVRLIANGDQLTSGRTDQLLLLVMDVNNDLAAAVWTGTAWTSLTTITTSASTLDQQAFDGAWESSSGDALVVYASGTTDTQTLTSKTLNTPTLNNPVLSGNVTGTFTFTTAPTFGTALTFPNAVEFGNGAHLTGGITRESVSIGVSTIINCSAGSYFTKTISSNTTFTFISPPAAGTLGEFTFALTHNSGAVPTWPTGVVWEGGVTPTYTSNRTSIYVFRTVDGGTRWYGVAFSNFVT
jgi:hypothetical protein